MKPPGALGDSATRVLLSVLDGATTWSEVMEATGLSRAGTHHVLNRLRREGLVDWARDDRSARRAGMLHPRCRIVPIVVIR